MGRSLVAQEQAIAKIFSDEYVFRIPGYQRPYSWATEQARDLLDDLLGFMKAAGSVIEKTPPYFLGSIVLIKDEGDPDAHVVDGQQRLTTLTLLLATIRALADTKAASEITPLLYEKGSSIKGTRDRFRLTLRERDEAFFQHYVQREDGFTALLNLPDELSDSQNNLRGNARFYWERLNEISQTDRIRLAQFVVTRCYLVVVATPDIDSAFRIFSVLNSRGLDLAATDILKAEIIGQIPPEHREVYTRKWEEAEEDLGRDAFNDLFSHIRIVYRKAKPQGTLLREFKDHVPVKDPRKFIDELLAPMTKAFAEITDSSYESTENAGEVNDKLKWLNHLEFSDWIPPSLAFMQRYRQQPDVVKAFFSGLERLSYAMLIMKWGINDRIERFSKLTAWVESGINPVDGDSPLQLAADEQYLVYAELDGPLYTSHSARAKSAILLRLDSLLSGGGATYDYPTVTIEHVLPQTPAANSKWIEWIPDEKDRLIWVHRLGNLALLTRKKNSSASNYEFDIKKRAYFSKGGISPFVLTTQVLERTTWTIEDITTRQRQLLGKLEDCWELTKRTAPTGRLTKSQIVALSEAPDETKGGPSAVQDEKVRTVRQQILLRFWAQLIERSRAVTPLFANRTPTKDHWLSAGIGRAGFWLSLSLTKDFATAECGIRVSKESERNKVLFNALRNQQKQVESVFGEPLNWEELPGKIGSRISKDAEGGWLTPEAEWTALQDKMIDMAVRMDKALKGPIQALKL